MKPSDIQPPTEFSRRLAAALKRRTSEAGVSQTAIREEMGRAQSYVSERMNGLRPPDTDLIEVAANLMKVDVRTLIRELLIESQRSNLSVVPDSLVALDDDEPKGEATDDAP